MILAEALPQTPLGKLTAGVRQTASHHRRGPTMYGRLTTSTATSLPVLLIIGPKCTLAASYTALTPGESRRVCRRDRQTDGRTPDRYTTLSARGGQRNNLTAGQIWRIPQRTGKSSYPFRTARSPRSFNSYSKCLIIVHSTIVPHDANRHVDNSLSVDHAPQTRSPHVNQSPSTYVRPISYHTPTPPLLSYSQVRLANRPDKQKPAMHPPADSRQLARRQLQ